MIQYLKLSETIEELELDNKYHLEQLEIINNIITNLENEKKYLEERLRLDKIRVEKLKVKTKN